MINKISTVFVFIILIISSCTFQRKINDYSAAEDFYNSINRQGKEREVYITFNNDSVTVGAEFKISSDSSYWYNLETGDYCVEFNTNIKQVMYKHHLRGMLNGFLIGGPIAAGLAIPIVFITYPPTSGDQTGNIAPILIIAGAGFLGSLAGAIIGYNIADKHVYLLYHNKYQTK